MLVVHVLPHDGEWERHADMFETLKPGEGLLIEPMKGYPVIKDLAVDFGMTITTTEGVFRKIEGTIIRREN
jgi:succinate dehydrogenase/fumarate reductase-like Fe-S protein